MPFSRDGARGVAVAFLTIALALIAALALPARTDPPAAAAAATPFFTDVAKAAGIDYVQISPTVHLGGSQDPRSNAGGAAACDFDGDGFVDLLVTRLDAPPILYRNNGNGTFTDVTAKAGLDIIPKGSNGCCWGDVNNDGRPDLFITTLFDHRYYLFINQGDGTFKEEAVQRGCALPCAQEHMGTSCCFADVDNDGYLDLCVCEWIYTGEVKATDKNRGTRLLRNLGKSRPGYFEDVTTRSGIHEKVPNRPLSFAPRFYDIDGDGKVDLLLTSDFGTARLFWNVGGCRFVDGSEKAAIGGESNAMGNTVGDLLNDGTPYWFVSSINDNRLYRYRGNRTFVDHSIKAGVRQGDWGWGAAFFDYDNDGRLDLIQTNGMTYAGPGYSTDQTRLWHNDGFDSEHGSVHFSQTNNACGITDRLCGKGLLTFDYDNDGALDVFIVNTAAPPILYHNNLGSRNDWLKVRTVGMVSNRDGYGAVVTVTAKEGSPRQTWHVNGGSNYMGQSEATAHFGLGPAFEGKVARVDIRWPSGIRQSFENVEKDKVLIATEPNVPPPPATSRPAIPRPIPLPPLSTAPRGAVTGE